MGKLVIDKDKMFKVNYVNNMKPLRDEIIGMMKKRPSLKERKSVAERVTDKILGFVETFINGISGE